MQALARRLAVPLTFAVLVARLFTVMRRVIRKQTPWTQLVLPGLVLVELLRIRYGHDSRWGLAALAGLFEGLVLVVAFLRLRQSRTGHELALEQRLVESFQLFLPEGIARFGAYEAAIVGAGLTCLRKKPPHGPGEFSYTKMTAVPYIPLIFLVGSVPETLLFETILAHAAPWVRWGFLALNCYGLLWICGTVSLMARRPHRVTEYAVTLQRGLGYCTFPRTLIQSVTAEEGLTAAKQPGVARFSVGGAASILVALAEPVQVRSAFGGMQTARYFRVSADDLRAFQQALAKR